MPFLVRAILAEFKPVVISSQRQYERHKRQLRFILSFEPGWAAPALCFDRQIECCKTVIYSDPHYRPLERREYFETNGFDYVLSLYCAPFFKHFKKFPEKKFIHFPWAVPDLFVSSVEVMVKSNEVAIFGGRNSAAYDLRNWCREQGEVTNYDFSGVENKKLSDEEYYRWLLQFDAVVAAGSSNPVYNLVTPKYFEITAVGALLIGQYCEDLLSLGFHDDNCLIFSQEDFVEKVAAYRQSPETYLAVRERGRELIRSRHLVSHRLETLRELYNAV
jgi:hypothetical protein